MGKGIETEVAKAAEQLASAEGWILEEQFEAQTGLTVTGGTQSDAICALEQFVVSHTSKDVWSHFFGDVEKVRSIRFTSVVSQEILDGLCTQEDVLGFLEVGLSRSGANDGSFVQMDEYNQEAMCSSRSRRNL